MASVISVEKLSKKYLLRHQGTKEPYLALRDILAEKIKNTGSRLLGSGPPAAATRLEEFWALNDVSFEVEQGDRIGIIGSNGAGKSTLLKILSRITEPSKGTVRIRGRVASLLEVGTGFHPELTGRENIFLNGAVLGMGHAEIRARFDQIVDFAEIEKFLDTPVKRYSSGMYMRLAFAVAAHLEPEILVVDEVLAVGDAQFQAKCLGKMEEVSNRQGRTVLFVSHNLAAVRSLCTKGLLLENGTLNYFGSAAEAVERYLAPRQQGEGRPALRRVPRSGTSKVAIVDAALLNLTRKSREEAEVLDDLLLTICYEVHQPVKYLAFEWAIRDSRGAAVAFSSSAPMDRYLFTPALGANRVECRLKRIPLSIGRYSIDLSVTIPNIECLDAVEGALVFSVTQCDPYQTGSQYRLERGPVFVETEWIADNKIAAGELSGAGS
ncbi:ABC transporter ATP-binding protein [Geomonas silvestris]|uniref:ABC transporter ATP-binding protein n=1 Tax=Geomonas silvestris TaxID=2740184 RepID=A0A6V8MDB1_9BACT|nr:ABC transporter ATP-binding protein [Geomonas silvestris]GFO57947.1 ABC transporter ATP-binding protein [Geomonas silvestris]